MEFVILACMKPEELPTSIRKLVREKATVLRNIKTVR